MDGTHTQIGISSSAGCHFEGPSVYNRVASYVDCISSVTGIEMPDFSRADDDSTSEEPATTGE